MGTLLPSEAMQPTGTLAAGVSLGIGFCQGTSYSNRTPWTHGSDTNIFLKVARKISCKVVFFWKANNSIEKLLNKDCACPAWVWTVSCVGKVGTLSCAISCIRSKPYKQWKTCWRDPAKGGQCKLTSVFAKYAPGAKALLLWSNL